MEKMKRLKCIDILNNEKVSNRIKKSIIMFDIKTKKAWLEHIIRKYWNTHNCA